ncbi:MAG: GspH/FimT family pseudopilin [Sedimentisphaerales bacterium]|nr:GspH/FimT family pseudopilin [Sedimentisphaerales bacterium]
MPVKRFAGFTLVELMVTLAVFAILAALAAPSFNGILEKRRLVGAAEGLFADLQFAKAEAIKRNRTIRLQVTTGNTWCYGLDDDAGTACDCNSNACELGSTSRNITSSEYENIQLVNGSVVEFEPVRGMPDTTATFQFRIGDGGDVKNVTVSSIGRIKMD